VEISCKTTECALVLLGRSGGDAGTGPCLGDNGGRGFCAGFLCRGPVGGRRWETVSVYVHTELPALSYPLSGMLSLLISPVSSVRMALPVSVVASPVCVPLLVPRLTSLSASPAPPSPPQSLYLPPESFREPPGGFVLSHHHTLPHQLFIRSHHVYDRERLDSSHSSSDASVLFVALFRYLLPDSCTHLIQCVLDRHSDLLFHLVLLGGCPHFPTLLWCCHRYNLLLLFGGFDTS